MKQDCAWIRRRLPQYLRGYVFRTTRKRIDRHLQDCVVCKSEFEALRRMEETRELLKNIDPVASVARRVREGVSTLTKLKKILYRPLWLAGIALAVAGVAYYAMLPRQLDLEIESIVKTSPATTAAVSPAEPIPEASVVSKPEASVHAPSLNPAPGRVESPLAVSIVTSNETAALQRVNEVMSGHEKLRTLKFSETERQQSGTLTRQELLTFIDRMGKVAKVRYDRKRLKAFPDDQPVPFVLTLKATPKAGENPKTASHPVQSAETHTPAGISASPPLVTAPVTTAAQ